MTVTVTAPPPIATVRNVELMHTGTWNLPGGETTFTVDDLANAVGAMDCPAVRRPILKLGHTQLPAPGQPAVGFVANMATAENGRTLVGDYVGMPGWLTTQDAEGNSVLTSAYPDRSIEGEWDFRCQLGHTHPFVVLAIALLGEDRPGIGTIQSLQDLADLYGVAATADDPSGNPVNVVVRASEGSAMPNPRPLQVAASVTTEDVRRAFYATPAGADWSTWIEEMQLDPMQLIVLDDQTNTRSRVPFAVGDGDGQEAVSFSAPIPVVVRYDDASAAAASAPSGRTLLRYASRDESRPPSDASRPGASAAPAGTPSAAVAAESAPPQRGAGMNPAMIREALGLGPDASDDEVRSALAAAGLAGSPAPPVADTATPDAETTDVSDQAPTAVAANALTMTVSSAAWEEREARLKRLEAQAAKQRRDERDQVIAEAITQGKFPPAVRGAWQNAWDRAPEETRAVIAGLTKNVVPVSPTGFSGDLDDGSLDDEFAHLFPPVLDRSKGA